MQRVTVTLDDDLMAELDAIIAERGYQNRSEAIRDLARAGIKEAAPDSGRGRDCVAALVYVYDHEARQLSKRLARAYHDQHELSLASLHVHLDHDTCLEVTVLRGKSGDVQHFGEHVIAERGVRHGKLVRMPVETPAASSGSRHRSHHHHDHDQVAPKPPQRRSKASCGKDPRMLSGRCLPMARSSGPRMTSGKSSPGSGLSIASKILRDVDGNAGIRSLPRSRSLTKRD